MTIERLRRVFENRVRRTTSAENRVLPAPVLFPQLLMRLPLVFLALVVCSLASVQLASAQGVQTVIHARARVFPDVGAGAAKIVRDPVSGRYYILAKPETILAVYGADGKRIGDLPNTKSGTAAELKYAVDFDIDSKGRVYVADRGDNRIKIFAPDGSLESSVYINAPMSVVALPNDQFAVVTLRTDHLVKVMDIHGKFVRSFGSVNDAIGAKTQTSTVDDEPQGYSAGYSAQYAAHTPETFAMNIGRLYGDESGHIFFAFTALDDPMFRKYDPYGYSVFEATVPAESLIPDIDRGDARFQVGGNISGMAGVGNFFSFGTMYSVGGNANFTVRGGNGGGGGGGGRHGGGGGGIGGSSSSSSGNSSSSSSGSSSSSNGNGGSGTSHFTSSEYTSSDTGSYATDSSGLFTTTSDSTSVGGTNGNLSFDSSSASIDSGDASALLGVGGMAGLYGATGSNIVLNQSGWAGADNAGLLGIFGPRGPGAFGPGGGPGGFHGGGFGGPNGGEGQALGPIGSTEAYIPALPGGADGKAGAANIAGGGAGTNAPPKPGGAATTPQGHAYGGEHGDYNGHGYGHGIDTHSYSAVVRFNQVEKDLRAKPVIHAIAADPASNEVWVTIGDVLLHFDSSGNREDSYLVTTNTGAPLSPVGILVEPNRLLLVGDPTGIYDFARPDKVERTAHQTAVTAQTKSSATQAAPAFVASTPASTTKSSVAPGTTAKSNPSPQ
jgi:hypothetical protein